MTSAAFRREMIDKVRSLGRKRLLLREGAPPLAPEEAGAAPRAAACGQAAARFQAAARRREARDCVAAVRAGDAARTC